jgi:hypothetical protein
MWTSRKNWRKPVANSRCVNAGTSCLYDTTERNAMNDTNAQGSINDVDSGDEFDLALLDTDLDDIETLPGFETPSAGQYVLKLTTALKKVNKNINIETSYELVECIKKDNDSDPDSMPGTKFSQLYTIKSGDTDPEKKKEAERMGKGKLKELLLGIAESTGEGNLMILVRDVIASCIVTATVKRRQDREDKERFYPVIKNLSLQ